jgi:hypothetical protein
MALAVMTRMAILVVRVLPVRLHWARTPASVDHAEQFELFKECPADQKPGGRGRDSAV